MEGRPCSATVSCAGSTHTASSASCTRALWIWTSKSDFGWGFEGSVDLTLRDELVFVTLSLTYRGTTIELPDVLLDTGAVSTVINADLAADAGSAASSGWTFSGRL